MSLKIIKAGILDTLQDQGRFGYQHLGINPGGAMDRFGMQVANLLAGNEPQEAVMEMHFPGPAILFQQTALIALAGADFSAHVNGEPVHRLQPIIASNNSILRFHAQRSGARAYLAVHGGFAIESWLGSRSTNLKAGAGGYNGRALQKEDELPFRRTVDDRGLQQKEQICLPWRGSDLPEEGATGTISILPGKEWELLSPALQQQLLNTSFLIGSQSDRMGYRLQGEAVQLSLQEELVSSPVCFGAIQLLPDGQLIILMADHQTTGGYPVIAQVISAHHSRLAQRRPGDVLQFRLADQAVAEKLWLQQHRHLLQLQNACIFRLEEWLKT
ncbi:MAG: biotin-dependent carboxyltransferase family protein [Chitinophagaceae bacterium]